MTASLAQKLRMKTDMRRLIVGAPAGYVERLAPLPDGADISSTPSGTYTFIQVFVKQLSEMGQVSRRISKHAAPNAVVWISYPKKGSAIASDLSRDAIREQIAATGWDTVAIVAIDETWAALRIRPNGKVRSRSRRA